MMIAKDYQESINFNYSHALLVTQERKTCTNLSKNLNVSHDSIYRELGNPTEYINLVKDNLKELAKKELSKNNLYLLIDDMMNLKEHACLIEGLELGFDGSSGRPGKGLQMVNALLTDGSIKIPIDTIPYFSRQLVGADYKSKSDLAMLIINDLSNEFPFSRLLADAHYATKNLISFLVVKNINFLMKLPRNRMVTIEGKTDQIRNIFKLKKNAKIRSICGIFCGIPCYFYVIKLENKSTVYLISNDLIETSEVIKLYKIRWKIELFHRTAKQSLGLRDCQARTIEKQRLHALYAMYAYAIADIKREKEKLESTEDAIRSFRIVKSLNKTTQLSFIGENLC